jgi:hypothetical protein
LNRIVLAFRCFFGMLFGGKLSDELLADLGLARRKPAPAAPAPVAPVVRASDGALILLTVLQREARLVDFVMEDIAAYSDEQVGAAVRGMHDQCRDALGRYVKLEPVIDGVEGTFTKPTVRDPAAVKFVGNVPAGKPQGGLLRHKGWRASSIDLPALAPKQDVAIVAPAEIEVE